MKLPLPKGVPAAQFQRFLRGCSGVVGADHVASDEARVTPYGSTFLPFDDAEHMPGAAVAPASLEEVQAILALARATKVPLWPTSTGRNFGYGTSTVADAGTVVLDMRRMNRILDMDPVLGTVVVEPGVTYQQLHDSLREHGHDFWLDFPGPGPLVSPMGNTLERGNGQTPYGDHFANTCGFEVLLADGTLFRTGMGGVRNTTSWQSFRYGYGPTLDGIFTQSNFGIVTKMGLWMMPAPETYRSGLAIWPNAGDIETLVDTIRPLRLDGTLGNFGTLGNATLFVGASELRSSLYKGPGAIPQDIVMKYAREHGLGAWMYLFSVYGRKERVAADWAHIVATFEKSGAHVIPDIDDPMAVNKLTLKSFSLLNWKGGHGLIWFSPVAPARGKDVARQMALAERVTTRHGLDFMTGLTANGREMLNVIPIVYDRENLDERARARACMFELLDAFEAAGYGLYRTGIGFMDRVAQIHGAKNLEVNRRIKRALDPDGILAPGKSGIRI